MKKIRSSILLTILASQSMAQTVSPKVLATCGGHFNDGNRSLSWTAGETFAGTFRNPNRIATIGFHQPGPKISLVNIGVFLEGYYRNSGDMVSTLYDLGLNNDPDATDTLRVNLWKSDHLSNPAPDYSQKAILKKNGTISFSYKGVKSGSYYLAIIHRNGLETWSSNPLALVAVNDYNFRSSHLQAYNDGVNPPMRNMGGNVFAVYNGDITRDGTIDINDMAVVENDATAFAFGYNISDVNGDGASDINDMAILENNGNLFLFYARPY